MDVVHRLRRESLRRAHLLPPARKQRRVEDVDILDCEPIELPLTQRRDHVQVDVASVRVVGAGPEP
jgi:hypothetical protein